MKGLYIGRKLKKLKNGSLDLLIGDRPLLDYYRGTDDSCSLIDVSEHDKIGDDTYAVAMARGFPLRETISSLVAKYIANGYMDYLQGKWYGQMACFRSPRSQVQGARALGVDAVAGMFIMLGVGMGVGLLILVLELIVYKYALPYFRKQPRGTLWRSPNLMFFSQKLYRFINCVELVSPHHAAKELVNTLRHGQITSLFQKSVKRKEHEQRRRRKSKAQFFEMIQEIRRVQRHDRQLTQPPRKSSKEKGSEEDEDEPPIYSIQARLESNKQTPKVIRILGEHVEFEDQQLQPPSSHSQDHLSDDIQQSSRKTSRSSIFSSHRNSQSLSGSRISLPRSPAAGPSPASGKGFRFKSRSEKHVKTKSNSKTITMSSAIVKSSGEKKPLKTILKRGSCPNSSNFPLGDFSPSSSMVAIGKKLASASSPTPSLTKLTKVMKTKKRLASESSGGRDKDVNFSSADESNDESDISAQERAEILTVNLTSLTKNEVIDLWKSSETELKSQLAQALKVQEELLEKLRALTESQPSKDSLEKKSSAFLKHEEFQPP
ncbi:unnamed protein product [Allacma fusca]|uniref:Uncharacterized protein n=1 Tax=Allacma fusca TaxID=39272 RepID=A0A8J2PLM3_9HEXA|nr:unnamed protein product [Allacma fusca]